MRDTGRGLTAEEKDLLFTRFSQASPRTHIKYGGSGLGLFISRRLTEMQGGAIGFASEPGKGSVFSFYIKVRRSANKTPSKLTFEDRSRSFRRSREPQSTGSISPSDRTVSATDDLSTSSALESPAVSEAKNPEAPPFRPEASPLPSIPSPSTPSSSAPTKASQQTRPAAAAAAVASSPKKALPGSHIHCLVVEDNLVNQRVLAKGLRNVGCSVHVANHGKEALDIITGRDTYILEAPRGRQVVVLLDWEMPIMDGLTCVRKVREWEEEEQQRRRGEAEEEGRGKGVAAQERRRLPVIGVTANARPQQIAEAMEAGMDDVVSKPFRVPELLERIEGLFAQLRERDAGREGEKGDG
ncbi:hypothetical protein LTS18_012826 [Coniosporium uncinatum]|uniref:Uncharacterized protein n=1 Tax=Coniosporium uncinatum TaxID=93489 RepID=A0ACC3CWT5_9PEZI|nr:hypothetical protein LTS18_012826 [Coniosporium uncinatum]